jgi:hypothetical protein
MPTCRDRTVLAFARFTAESFAFGVETVGPTEVIYNENPGIQHLLAGRP